MNEETGLGNWARILAKEYDGRLTVLPEGVRLEGSSDRWEQSTGGKDPILLMSRPQTPEQWRERLKHVEKRAARAVMSGPVGFSCSVAETKRVKTQNISDAKVVRFAFGLSLSLGQSCYRRYTAYYVSATEETFFLGGQDSLFESCENLGGLDLNDRLLSKGLPRVISLLPDVEADYNACGPVRAEVKRLNEAVSTELRDLDRLYLAGYGQYALLLGKAPERLRGEDAIESEYLAKMNDILERFKVSIILKPLSLGLVSCKVRVSKKAGGTQAILPFVDKADGTLI